MDANLDLMNDNTSKDLGEGLYKFQVNLESFLKKAAYEFEPSRKPESFEIKVIESPEDWPQLIFGGFGFDDVSYD